MNINTIKNTNSQNHNHHMALILPVYNEADAIYLNYLDIKTILDENSISIDIVFIDDGSNDGTRIIIQEIKKENPHVKSLHFDKNYGKEVALYAALENFKYEKYIIADSDLQHPPIYIPRMIKEMDNSDYNMLIGIKEFRGIENNLYRFLANLFYSLLKITSGIDFKNSSDFMILDKKSADKIISKKYKNFFFRGCVNKIDVRKSYFKFDVKKRKYGKSSFSLTKLVKLSLIAIFSNIIADDEYKMYNCH